MRIISDFHDYYDSCMAHGSDERIVYHRKTQDFTWEGMETGHPLEEIKRSIKNRYSNRGMILWVGKKPNRFLVYLYKEFVIFCGKIYPTLRCVRQSTVSTPSEVKYFYEIDDCVKYLSEINKEEIDKEEVKQIRDYILSSSLKIDTEWLIANKLSVALVTLRQIFINPRLKDCEFYKIFDSYTAFQELDMFVCGTLAYPHNFMVEVSDKDKVKKHGFDVKYGFRKRPKRQ